MNDELMHHGVLGMKWGVRRYRNPDGSLNAKGIKRYGNGKTSTVKQHTKLLNDLDEEVVGNKYDSKKAGNKYAKLDSRRSRAELQGKTEKANKLSAKANIAKKRMVEAEKTAKKYKNEIDNHIKYLKKEGYSVNSEDFYRWRTTGASIAAAVLIDPVYVPIFGAAQLNDRGKGTRYYNIRKNN